MRIFLFDIDGVLVKPFGYRKAYFDTCQWVIDKGELRFNLPPSDIPALFESFGVTSEWDMLAITCVIMLNFCCESNWLKLDTVSLEDALRVIASSSKKQIQIDFRQKIIEISHTFHGHEIPSIGLYRNNRGKLASLPESLLENILCYTRSVRYSLITRVFQNMVLGAENFKETCKVEPLIRCDSYLQDFDVPLLDEETRSILNKFHEKTEILFAALTARPSLSPRDAENPGVMEYSPEAEFALDVIQMPDMPLIGYGRLQYVERELGISADLLIKPDSFHALAAIFTLLCGSEKDGLFLASEVRKGNGLIDSKKRFPDEIEISVFEDSQGGIRSVVMAAEQLNELGIATKVKLFGITQNSDKERTLLNQGVKIFPDINAALKHAIYEEFSDN